MLETSVAMKLKKITLVTTPSFVYHLATRLV